MSVEGYDCLPLKHIVDILICDKTMTACLMFFLFLLFEQPPIAGSINWARCLFSRLKRTMQKFETVGNDMMKDPAAQEVSNIILYLTVFHLVTILKMTKLSSTKYSCSIWFWCVICLFSISDEYILLCAREANASIWEAMGWSMVSISQSTGG